MTRIRKKIMEQLAAVFILSLLVSACAGASAGTGADNAQSEHVNAAESPSVKSEVSRSEKDGASERKMVGDIILADGSVVKAEDLLSIQTDNLPIAVVAEVKEDGHVLGVGVHRSDSPLQWAQDGEYPAFDFVNAYAQNCHLSGDYASGWYLPSIEELCTVYENCETVNISLQRIYELDSEAAMDGLGTNWYWSSSQSDSNSEYAWFVHYFNGYSSDCPKTFTNLHVLAVRIF